MKPLSTLFFCLLFFPLLAQQPFAPEHLEEPAPEARYQITPEGPEGNLPEDYRVIARYRKTWNPQTAEWMHSDSSEYAYADDGNLSEVITLRWDSILWAKSLRSTYTYNENGQRTAYLEESWDGADWDHRNGNAREIQEYNEAGSRTLFNRQQWQNGEWLDNFKTIYEYDPATGYLTVITSQFSFLGPGQLVNAGRTLYSTYDSQGNALILVRQNWDEENEAWLTQSRDSIEYYNEGKRSLVINQLPDGENWKNNRITTYAYNSTGQILIEERAIWDNQAEEWTPSYKYEYEYNSNGDYTQFMYSFWDDALATWINSDRRVREFDDDLNVTLELSERWDPDMGSWINNYRFILTYDENGNRTSTQFQPWQQEENYWQNTDHYTFYYELFVDTENLQLLDAALATIAPNPSNGQFQIRFDAATFTQPEVQLRVFNLMGQPLANFKLLQTGAPLDVNLSGLPGGTYLLQAWQGNKMVSKRVVITK